MLVLVLLVLVLVLLVLLVLVLFLLFSLRVFLLLLLLLLLRILLLVVDCAFELLSSPFSLLPLFSIVLYSPVDPLHYSSLSLLFLLFPDYYLQIKYS